MDIKNWVEVNLTRPSMFAKESKDWEILFGSVLWNIWIMRNSIVFNNPMEDNTGILERSCRMTNSINNANRERDQANKSQPIELVGPTVWLPPSEGWEKLNTDVARRNTDGKAACGGVIRDLNEKWRIGFKKFIGICSTMEAELWGVYTGLRCAWEQGIQQLIVEVYSLEAIQTLKNSTNKEGNITIISYIRELINRDWNVRLQHVRR
ncbi:hypothetical protein F3Y22_tig00112319pilonHSYRG00071 [Hibiscus syriacus]|uniref:RNase H type-1 domain-containing protein n=1 Tax=Hibiscus syriacus TaxID=106335 RepID=A0A6A2XFD4_HIBSY|nr:hypothetical protein F3Y22_tig00112319pilonHSYRG00071 [Hibiscus syriacus]